MDSFADVILVEHSQPRFRSEPRSKAALGILGLPFELILFEIALLLKP